MLTDSDKKLVLQVWEKVIRHPDCGAEALERLFTTYPQTKTYFPHFDLHHGSDQVRNHGKKVLAALGNAVKSLGNLSQALSDLSDLHAYNLRLLAQCFHVVLATHLGNDYTPEAHAAFDKFLSAVCTVLAEKYR
ncbi:Hbad [Columba livia]|nr:Hbad [Columba livia]